MVLQNDTLMRIKGLQKEKLALCTDLKRHSLKERRLIFRGDAAGLDRDLDNKSIAMDRLETIDSELEKLFGEFEENPGLIPEDKTEFLELQKELLAILNAISNIEKRNEELLKKARKEVLGELEQFDQSLKALKKYQEVE